MNELTEQVNVQWSWQDLDEESHRQVIFVRYPPDFTIERINELLDWAKWRRVQSLYSDGCLVMCGVKPPYMKHFLGVNADYVLNHTARRTGYEVSYEVDGAIYD